jgi:hypothetical protein
VSAITVGSFRPVRKNTLIGFFSVSFGSLQINDCSIHRHANGTTWVVALPGKPVLDQDGRHKRDVKRQAAIRANG